jgi:rod shape determining protein RodA
MTLNRPDPVIMISLVVILLSGMLAVFSASRAVEGEPIFVKQLLWTALGMIALWAGMRLPLRVMEEFAYPFYAFSLVLLLVTIFFGGGPAGRWLAIGPLNLQASEVAKVAIVIATSRAFADLSTRPRRFGVFAIYAATIPAIVLTWLQPDLGTAGATVLILLMMTWWAGFGPDWIFLLISPLFAAFSSMSLVYWILFTAMLILILLRRKAPAWLWIAILVGNTVVAVFTPIVWNLLRPYQQARLTTFLNPAADPHGAGWNVIQSEVAVGSGGVWGQGFLQGAQKELAFLPARHTDFVFSVWAEELGLAGSILLLAAFLVLMSRFVWIASKCSNSFTSMIAAGVAAYFAVHVAVNVGMTIGIMPVTGIPLVLVSYGGSHMLTAMFLVGVGLNAGMNWRVL